MTGRRAAGWFPGDSPDRRRYVGHPEESRRELFAKDRENRRLAARVAHAESTLGFIWDVARGRVGGNDLPWIVATVLEAIDRYDLPGHQRRHRGDDADLAAVLASLVTVDDIADCRGVPLADMQALVDGHDDFPAPAVGADRYWWPDVAAWLASKGHHDGYG